MPLHRKERAVRVPELICVSEDQEALFGKANGAYNTLMNRNHLTNRKRRLIV